MTNNHINNDCNVLYIVTWAQLIENSKADVMLIWWYNLMLFCYDSGNRKKVKQRTNEVSNISGMIDGHLNNVS